MNITLITQGLSALNSLRGQLKKNKEDRSLGDYDALRESALKIQDLRDRINTLADGAAKDKVRRGMMAAGPVTQSTRLRLEQAREDVDNSIGALVDKADKATRKSRRKAKKQARKTSKRVQRQAEKAAQKVTEKLSNKKKSRWGLRIGIGFALFWVIAYVVYLVFGVRQREYSENIAPPRVEEEGGEQESTLVYSTSTEEAPAERDEELLNSLDEQLRVNNENK